MKPTDGKQRVANTSDNRFGLRSMFVLLAWFALPLAALAHIAKDELGIGFYLFGAATFFAIPFALSYLPFARGKTFFILVLMTLMTQCLLGVGHALAGNGVGLVRTGTLILLFELLKLGFIGMLYRVASDPLIKHMLEVLIPGFFGSMILTLIVARIPNNMYPPTAVAFLILFFLASTVIYTTFAVRATHDRRSRPNHQSDGVIVRIPEAKTEGNSQIPSQ